MALMPLRDMSAGMHHVTVTPASITYNTRLLSQSMRWTRLLLVHDVIQPVQSCWLIEAVPHRGGSIALMEQEGKVKALW